MKLHSYQHFRFMVIGFFISSIMTASITSSVMAQPAITVNKTSIDAGPLISGEVFRSEWIIKNNGTDTLVIENVHTSCGCTSAKMPKDQLLPKQSDTLVVTFNSAGFLGKVTKYIEITSNDPKKKSTVLSFTVDVKSKP